MYHQLFVNSPLLVFPLIGLATFVAFFVATTVRVYARRAAEYDHLAALPLAGDEAQPGEEVRHG